MWIPISCCPYGFKTELFHHLCLLLNKQFSHGLVELIISMLIFEPNLVKIWISNGDLLAIQESQIYLKSEFPMATSGEPNCDFVCSWLLKPVERRSQLSCLEKYLSQNCWTWSWFIKNKYLWREKDIKNKIFVLIYTGF